ncbi:SDR family oxidoreductase [Arthrobacter cryoconiti]|nr:SDR family oxidoreductase [Arthrobacter cryoconiti]MCC9067509.1 SDR family oxidoreductase [Arthrobacter cryoconiti]
MNMTGNTILITGGTSGIGLGLAQRFQDEGNTVIIAGRRRALLESISANNPGIFGLPLDVDDPASINALRDTVLRDYPELNVLITAAGIMHPENLLDPAHLSTAEATISSNLLGPIRTITALAPLLVGKPDATIITVSSGLAFVPLSATPTYNATKAGIHAYSEVLRQQLSPAGIQVLELIPPAVRTALMGSQEAENAMPLDEFLSEVMSILHEDPDAKEILVENVKPLRFAAAQGTYDKIFALLADR